MGTQNAEAPAQIPKRPHYKDPQILAAAAAKMAPDLQEWFEGSSVEEIVAGLTEALKHTWSLDGYDIAKRLEDRRLCEPNAQMVEELDVASGVVWQEHNAELKRWVSDNNITLPRKIGDRVKCRHGIGVINEVDAQRAIYLFKPDGSTQFESGGGIHVTDEDLEDAPVQGAPADA